MKHQLLTSRLSLLMVPLLLMAGCKPFSPQGERLRHYDVDYNFLVTADSLVLQEDRPMHMLIVPETSDSMVVRHGEALVVAQIEVIPEDSTDSVWVKVARDQLTQGWVHESTLLDSVVPDDPISQGIHIFSDAHVETALALVMVALVAWLWRRMRKWRFHLVHVDDIASPYPMLLCLAFAAATVLYTSIQLFVPELWAHFYYNPTLNPFGQPTMLSLFLALAWLIVILFIASLDDIRRCLPAVEAVLYTLSLLAVLGAIYLVFSLATQYFLGYLLLMLYVASALAHYWQRHRAHFRCGQCHAPLHDKGQCPKCGAVNE